jgi:hypothetical protein
MYCKDPPKQQVIIYANCVLHDTFSILNYKMFLFLYIIFDMHSILACLLVIPMDAATSLYCSCEMQPYGRNCKNQM